MNRKYLRKIKRIFKPVRGLGFPGDGQQRQRSKQIEVIGKLFPNPVFLNNYPDLLRCNESHTGVADSIDVSRELELYHKSLSSWLNYSDQIADLSGWVDPKGHVWPKLHPAHQHVVDVYNQLKPKTVCEVGAGAGVVAKYVYAASEGQVGLTCVEGSKSHLASMELNFSGKSNLIAPNIPVKANIVKAAAQDLPFAENSFELVYTCTLMMHIPYIPAVLAAAEVARVSNRYVLHVEGYHTDGIVRNFKSKYNFLLLDYERLYNKLGFKMVKKFFYQDPYSTDYDYIVFLAEKMPKVN